MQNIIHIFNILVSLQINNMTSDTQRPLILISNDDGIQAPGLLRLIDSLDADMGRIVVFAPATPQSGKASAITVDEPLWVKRLDDYSGAEMWSVSGTPVDCVKMALHLLSPRLPDLMLSGINHGSNSGNSVIYSGTMGAVMEACMAGIPSIGFSLLHHSLKADFSQCRPTIRTVVNHVMNGALPTGVCLNVNIPAQCTPLGLRVCEASGGHWTEEYVRYTDPHGRPYYWLTGKYVDDNPDNPATDNYWLARQYSTIVPVLPDQTFRPAIEPLKRIFAEEESFS